MASKICRTCGLDGSDARGRLLRTDDVIERLSVLHKSVTALLEPETHPGKPVDHLTMIVSRPTTRQPAGKEPRRTISVAGMTRLSPELSKGGARFTVSSLKTGGGVCSTQSPDGNCPDHLPSCTR